MRCRRQLPSTGPPPAWQRWSTWWRRPGLQRSGSTPARPSGLRTWTRATPSTRLPRSGAQRRRSWRGWTRPPASRAFATRCPLTCRPPMPWRPWEPRLRRPSTGRLPRPWIWRSSERGRRGQTPFAGAKTRAPAARGPPPKPSSPRSREAPRCRLGACPSGARGSSQRLWPRERPPRESGQPTQRPASATPVLRRPGSSTPSWRRTALASTACFPTPRRSSSGRPRRQPTGLRTRRSRPGLPRSSRPS
mmetsp:Transcript_23421/g.88941  ORF Transcript_23421/g.88941 Transcript_23421/m.88941 type:complete len:248 (-) Transcript_23421:479-1222(-)